MSAIYGGVTRPIVLQLIASLAPGFSPGTIALAANTGAFALSANGEYSFDITGALTAAGNIVGTAPGVTEAIVIFDNLATGNFILTLNAGAPIPAGRSLWYWDGAGFSMVSAGNTLNTVPVAMSANAGALVIAANGQINAEITGALTGTGTITPTVAAGVTDVSVNFDNTTSGGFPVQIAGLTIPPGRSTWYWNGSVFEMVSARGFNTALAALPGAGGVANANHLCGTVPFRAAIEVVCLTAEQNFSIGDVFELTESWNGATSAMVNVVKSSTTVTTIPITGFVFMGRNKTTGAAFSLTAANWNYRFVIIP